MNCNYCGAPMKDGEKFCSRCGKKAAEPAPEEKTVAAPHALSEYQALTDAISKFWPDWEIVDKLGEGSFGKVYKAKHEESGTIFHSAIKVIRIPQSNAEVDSAKTEIGLDANSTTAYFKGFVDECVNEIKLMISLKGTQNIVTVEDYKVIEHTDEIGWTIYIRMELLTSFSAYAKDKPLEEKDVIRLGIDICNALEFCNKLNVMHRDIKPENIFVSSFGIFKLGDFGIARKLEKATVGMSKKGTYNYMAPEIYAGSTSYDFKSDIYSLGIVLYKLMNNNRLPLLDPHAQTITYQQLQDAFDRRMRGEDLPAPCNASAAFSSVILAACAHDPQKRFSNATALKNMLNNVLNGAMAAPPAASKPKKPTNDLNRTVAAASTVSSTTVHRFDVSDQPGSAPKPEVKPAPKSEARAEKKNAREQEKQAKAQAKAAKKAAKKRMPTWKKVLIALLVLALLGGGTAGVMYYRWYTSTEQQVLRAMGVGDYEVAQEILLEDEEARDSETLAEQLIQRLDTIRQSFLDKTMEYMAACDEMDNIRAMGITGVDTRLNEVSLFVIQLNTSRTNFATAESFFASGDYVEAIEQYKLVIEEDPDYETAKARITEAADSYRTKMLADAATQASSENYAKAISLLEEALVTLPNDAKITEQIRIYEKDLESKNRSDTLAAAKAYADKGDYPNAIKTINALRKNNSADAEVTAAYEDYCAKYEAAVLKEADELVAEGEYDKAVNLLNTALKTLTGNQTLKDKAADIAASKPISLSTLTPINGGWTWNTGSPKDPFGNDYSGATNFVILCDDGWSGTDVHYAEYRLYGEYSRITGTLAPYTSIGKDSTWYLQIYADETLVYTSPEVGRKTDAFDFSVAIDGAEYIKIKISLNKEADAILSNFMIHPE